MEKLILLILKIFKVDYTVNEEHLVSNTQFYSFPAFSSVLDQFKIGSLAVHLKPAQLKEIDLPAIAHLQEDNGQNFVVVEALKNKEVRYYDGVKTKQEPLEVFAAKWSGNMLLLAPDPHAGEANYTQNKAAEQAQNWQKAIVILALGAVCTWLLVNASNGQAAAWLVLQLLGVGLCSLLLINEFGQAPAFVQQLCNLGKNTNCNAVLQSSNSKIFSWLSWSEMGFVFFVGNVFAAILVSDSAIMQFYRLLSPLLLLGGVVSVYFQWRLAWCTLCLAVLAVLCGSVLAVNPLGNALLPVNLKVGFGYALAAGLWFLVKPFVIAHGQGVIHKQELNTWKQNPGLFKAFLEAQEPVAIFEWPNEIKNEFDENPLVITLVSNPFCSPCAAAHEEISEWARYFEVKVQYRFVANFENKNEEAVLFIQHLLCLEGAVLRETAIADWYQLKNYKEWSNKYPLNTERDVSEDLNRHIEWSAATQIAYTPTVFIDGYELKAPYDIKQLKYYLRHLMAIKETAIEF